MIKWPIWFNCHKTFILNTKETWPIHSLLNPFLLRNSYLYCRTAFVLLICLYAYNGAGIGWRVVKVMKHKSWDDKYSWVPREMQESYLSETINNHVKINNIKQNEHLNRWIKISNNKLMENKQLNSRKRVDAFRSI